MGEAMRDNEVASLPSLAIPAWTWGSVSCFWLSCYDKLDWDGWPLLAGRMGSETKRGGPLATLVGKQKSLEVGP